MAFLDSLINFALGSLPEHNSERHDETDLIGHHGHNGRDATKQGAAHGENEMKTTSNRLKIAMAAIDNGDRIRSERLPPTNYGNEVEFSESDLADMMKSEPSVPETMARSMETQQKILMDKAASFEQKIAHYKKLLSEAKLGLSAIDAAFKVLKAEPAPKSSEGGR